MTTQVTLAYTVFLGGASQAQIVSLLSAVPLPQDLLNAYGVRVISDSTPGATPVVRTIVLGFNPTSAATATPVLTAQGDSGAGVESVTVSAPGAGYVAPPVVSFSGGRAAGVEESILNPSPDQPALAFAFLKFVSAAVASGGTGYSAGTFIEVLGGLAPGGTAAVLTPTIIGGVITAVAITSPGSGYTSPPVVVVVDPAATPGSGGAISFSLGVDTIEVTRNGGGYDPAGPSVVLTPIFQARFPPTSDQSLPFRNLFTSIFQQAVLSPVFAAAPVVA